MNALGATSGRAESPRPHRWRPIVFAGILLFVAAAGVATGLVANALRESDSEREAITANGTTAPTTKASPPAPEGFTAVRDENGSTSYTSTSKGFSITLPEDWAPKHSVPSFDGHGKLLFAASDRNPQYNILTEVSTTQLQIWRFKQPGFVTPRKMMQVYHATLLEDATIVGGVARLAYPAGPGNTRLFRFIQTTKVSGLRSRTIYLVLFDEFWYQITFSVPAAEANNYLSTFSSIAETLRST